MPTFGTKSQKLLKECHPKLVLLLRKAIVLTDFSILEATRNKADQEAAYQRGATKVHFPNSAHNQTPSVAVDLLPYPFHGWGDIPGFMRVMHAMMKSSADWDIPIRWGGDWDRDKVLTDETFRDLPHYELHPWRDWASGKLK